MRVHVKIDFNIGQDITVSAGRIINSDSANVSDFSKAVESNYIYKGFKGFQFAENYGEYPAIADGSYKYFPDDGYKGFMSAKLSVADGTFGTNISKPTLSITARGATPEYLYIQFDAVANIYAKKFRITTNANSNALIVNNTAASLLVSLSSLNLPTDRSSTDIYIEFIAMNKPYQSVRITQLNVSYIGYYTGSELKSVENSEQLFDSQMQISPGLIEQYADIVIYDRDNSIHTLAKEAKLSEEFKVTVEAIDQDGNTQTIGSYITYDWDVESNKSEISLQCTDNSGQLDVIYIDTIDLKTRTVDDLLTLIFSTAAVFWEYIDSTTKTYCQSISIPNNWWYKSTARELLDKVCILGQLRVYSYLNTFVIARCY
jgi:hypothetical protein